MLYVSTLQVIIALLVAIFGGFFIGQFLTKRKGGNWQSQYKELESQHKELQKAKKKETKQVNRLNQQVTTWQEKHETLDAKYGPLSKEVETLRSTLTEKNTAYDTLKNKSESELKTIGSRHERLEKEHQKLKEKYATDLKDSKGWKNTRERLNRTIDDYKFKWNKAEKEKAKSQEKLKEQTEKIEEAAATKKEFRRLRSAITKLKQDITYWEKKHFDTHHELAEAKDRIEGLEIGLKELDMLKKGDEIKQKNLMNKMEEYRTQLVYVNQKYKDLKTSMQ